MSDETGTGGPASALPDHPRPDDTTIGAAAASATGDATGAIPPASSETARIAAWLRGRLPAEWTQAGAPAVTVDRDEITVVVALAAGTAEGELAEEEAAGRITRFREDTRQARIAVAQEAERRYGRRMAWGARCGPVTDVFTNLAVPVMTRLRQPERLVLDTLVESGVARSRAHAVAWCVRLVGKHSGEWLGDLRQAMAEVERVRRDGPAAA
ncbi:MAG: hypothetical protein ACFCVF_16130 [Kineosporiaceae bacterium]